VTRRLLILTPFAERRGGSDSILLTFLAHLDRRRFEPVVALLGDGGFVQEIRAVGARTVVLPAGRMRNPLHLTATVARLTRLLRRERPDVILNWLSTAQVYGGPAAMLAGMSDRCVWWQLDLVAPRALGGARVADRLATVRARAVDQLATALPARGVGACSAAVAEGQSRIWPHRPTLVALPGINPPRAASPEEPARLRATLGIAEDAVVVGMVGRLFGWKGHHRLLEAIASLRGEFRRVHGLFVGGGGHRADRSYEDFLERRVRELELADVTTFTGQVDDAAPYIRLMDVLVNASAPEPFGLVILEAMAEGVPVVAIGQGGPSEILSDGESGVVVGSNDPRELAEGIAELLGDAELRTRIGAAGKERFLERFTGDRMTRAMERALGELVP
jgi:glycosyltransferase involved in cell wall biosynthesis